MEYGRTHSAELVDDMIAAIQSNRPSADIDTWLIDVTEAQSNAKDLFSTAGEHREFDVFYQIASMSDEMAQDRDVSAIRALEILLLCSAYAKSFLAAGRTKSLAQQGGAARISLLHWAKFVDSNRALPLTAFISKVIENFLLSQHFGVAAARYTEGKQRLRLTIEERGLVSMLNSTDDALRPFVSADRLDAMLSLMADAALLNKKWSSNVWQYSV